MYFEFIVTVNITILVYSRAAYFIVLFLDIINKIVQILNDGSLLLVMDPNR